MLDFPQLIAECSDGVAPVILERIVSVESSFNPWAIGVVGGYLARQPANREEAVATARSLHNAGWNFSLGLGQVNRHNLSKYGLDYESVFEPCDNLRVTARIFGECLTRALGSLPEEQAQKAAFSCYYSGNFTRGLRPEGADQQSYVDRIMAVKTTQPSASVAVAIPVIASPRGSAVSAFREAQSAGGRLSGAEPRHGVKELRGD
jgi:Transglycosylase SLT domain.